MSVLGVWPGAGRGPNVIAEGRTRVAFSTSSIPGNAQSFVACDPFPAYRRFPWGKEDMVRRQCVELAGTLPSRKTGLWGV